MCNRTQNDAIWGLIALFLTNQIARNTTDFKMNVIKKVSNPRLRKRCMAPCTFSQDALQCQLKLTE